MKKIAIFGAGGMGRETRWLIEDINKHNTNWEFIGYFDDYLEGRSTEVKKQIIGGLDELNKWHEEISLVVAIGNPIFKRKIVQSITNPLIKYATLIHPGVLVSNTNVNIGDGCIICAGNIITVDINIGKHVLLNVGTIVCHDSSIGDYTSIMPSVNVSGDVAIGEAVYIGTGTKIIHQMKIGNETIIGAGAVVSRSLPDNCTAVGVPAKPIKFQSDIKK